MIKPWESTGSPESTLSSPLGSYQGSPGGSSQEPSSKSYDSCWENTYEIMGVLEKMKLEERGSSKSNYHPGYEIKSLETSNVVVCPLLQEQTRAIQLSGLKQEQIQFQRVNEYRGKNHGQFQKNDNNRRTRPPSQIPSHRQVGSEMRAILLDGSGSRPTSCGTGVFLPRGATTATAPSEPPRRRGKGCATVLIPARVVQALQLHFDQLSVASGPKVGAFPPLHDVLVSNRDGMYSIQKRQSRKKPTHIQNEMILPQEWTY
ncbi:hypothetical protein RJT34_30084 [Clitoria ternatea]|uniref:Uncharacterized protein n=1 Tax=Clitoria ternatea TaxID=43366 RepID=A0AAN9I3Q8_CLITE